MRIRPRNATRTLAAAAAGLAAGAYAAMVGIAWTRYGRPSRPTATADEDALLDRFLPVFDVRTRHCVRVAAPAEVTFAAAREMNLLGSPLVRAIIRARELILGAEGDPRPRQSGLLAEAQAMGWGILADGPGNEVVVGAVTRPWEANVVFRALPPDEFAAFVEPGYVKIVWNLRADPDPDDADRSTFVTETRALPTDEFARARFRPYWSVFSPGMVLIRRAALGPLRAEAERLVAAGGRLDARH